MIFLRRLVLYFGMGWALVASGDPIDAAEPVPDQASRQEARALIAEAFEADFENAKTRQQKHLLSQKLLHVAAETLDHPAGRYELLESACQTAVEAGEADTVLLVIDELGAVFEVDTRRMKAAALYQLSKTLTRPEELKLLVPKMSALVDESLAADRYDIASPLATVTLETAKAARDKELLETAESLQTHVERMKAAHEAIQSALATLQDDPDNAEANLAVGRYECILHGRWKEGLPHLAKGADQQLKEFAAMELGKSPDALALGDGWWQLAENETGRAQENLKAHAAMWYRRALRSLNGLAKIKVEKRLQELETPPAEPMAVPNPAPAVPEAPKPAPRLPVLPGAPQAKAEPPAEQLQMIKFGLNWLAQQQLQDGGWSFKIGSDPGTNDSRTAATAMAILAFLRHGHTHDAGDYQQQVKQGLTFLGRAMRVGPNGGDLSDPAGTMYTHGLATLAICEAYGRTKDAKLRRAAESAVAFIIYAQHPTQGGWRYKPHQPGDTSVTGWQVLALKSAEAAGIRIPPATYVGARQFLLSVQSRDGSGFGYVSPGSAMTTSAIGWHCLLEMGANLNDPLAQQGMEKARSRGLNDGAYFTYYQAHLLRHGGRDEWAAYTQKTIEWLQIEQRIEGQERASWYYYPGGHLAQSAGRLGITAFSLLILAECQK